MLWPEDMPAASTVSLSANDDLVPCDLVRAQMEASPKGANVLVHPTAGHGKQQYVACASSTQVVPQPYSMVMSLPGSHGLYNQSFIHSFTTMMPPYALAEHQDDWTCEISWQQCQR